MKDFKVGDEVLISDILSLNDECVGKITEDCNNLLYRVDFEDCDFSYHHQTNLIHWPIVEGKPDFTSYCSTHNVLYNECKCNPF